MRFVIKNVNENLLVLIRKIHYVPQDSNGEEFSCVRYLSGGNYPRFHLFIRKEDNNLLFNLHLDQKKPSYKGVSAHSGEYEGDLVEQEKERIIGLFS